MGKASFIDESCGNEHEETAFDAVKVGAGSPSRLWRKLSGALRPLLATSTSVKEASADDDEDSVPKPEKRDSETKFIIKNSFLELVYDDDDIPENSFQTGPEEGEVELAERCERRKRSYTDSAIQYSSLSPQESPKLSPQESPRLNDQDQDGEQHEKVELYGLEEVQQQYDEQNDKVEEDDCSEQLRMSSQWTCSTAASRRGSTSWTTPRSSILTAGSIDELEDDEISEMGQGGLIWKVRGGLDLGHHEGDTSFASTADGFEVFDPVASLASLTSSKPAPQPHQPINPQEAQSSDPSADIAAGYQQLPRPQPLYPQQLQTQQWQQAAYQQQLVQVWMPVAVSNTPSEQQLQRVEELEAQAKMLMMQAKLTETAAEYARLGARQARPTSTDLAGAPPMQSGDAKMLMMQAKLTEAAAEYARLGARQARPTSTDLTSAPPVQSGDAQQPSSGCFQSSPGETTSDDVSTYTTVMLRHLPVGCTRQALLELLDSQGFKGSYDFVYLPVDFVKWMSFGYAFVNLVSNQEALRIWKRLDGFSAWPEHIVGQSADSSAAASCVCEVSWGDPLQGLSAHIERYRNSPVMHKDVPEYFKPVTFAHGTKLKFPVPTKRIRPPRLKNSNTSL